MKEPQVQHPPGAFERHGPFVMTRLGAVLPALPNGTVGAQRYGPIMASSLRNITFDCADALRLARFWAEVLGWNVYRDDDPEVVVAPSFPPVGDVPKLLFIPVPEPRTVKNRVHLDVQPADRSRDEAVARL